MVDHFKHSDFISDLIILTRGLPPLPNRVISDDDFKLSEKDLTLDTMVFVSLDEMFPFRNCLPSPCAMVKIGDFS